MCCCQQPPPRMGAWTPQRPGLGAAAKAVAGDPGFLDTVLLHPLPSGLQRPLLGPWVPNRSSRLPCNSGFLGNRGVLYKSMFSAKKAVKRLLESPRAAPRLRKGHNFIPIFSHARCLLLQKNQNEGDYLCSRSFFLAPSPTPCGEETRPWV